MESFDYIIAGAGSAGCPVARALSDNPQNKVLLLEAGPGADRFWINTPAGMAKLYFNEKLNWTNERLRLSYFAFLCVLIAPSRLGGEAL